MENFEKNKSSDESIVELLKQAHIDAIKNGTSEITLEEINQEIDDYRKGK